VQTVTTKAPSGSKRAQAFERGLRKAGLSKKHSMLLTKKLLLLSQPERIGKLVKSNKSMNVYAVSRPTENGRALVFRKNSRGGKSIVVFVPPRAQRRRAVDHK